MGKQKHNVQKPNPIVKITSDEFDGSLIDFQANRSQFTTGRLVFLRELLAHQLKTFSLCRTSISIVDSIAN